MNLRIVAKGVRLSDTLRSRIERRLYFALGRFSSVIKSVDLTLRDENGPRRGVDKYCRIIVKTHATRDVVIEGRGEPTTALVDRTADRAGRAVARALDARQQKAAVRTSGHVGGRRS